jgi:hypothetical protein
MVEVFHLMMEPARINYSGTVVTFDHRVTGVLTPELLGELCHTA